MHNEFLKWLLGVITSAGLLTFLAFFMRTTLSKIFTRTIEFQFEKKFEKFKADIRDNETELGQIRTFLSSARRERDSALQNKRFEAAEQLMRSRQFLSQLTPLVEYTKLLKTEEILKDNDNPKISNFINTLIGPFNIDEKLNTYKSFDKTIMNLYLSEKTKKTFEIYEFIIFSAVTTMKLLSIPGLKVTSNIFKKEQLVKMVIEEVPPSKKGFDDFGDNYIYYWANYFYEHTLTELRNELHGDGNMSKDTEAATRIAIDSRSAQYDIRSSLNKYGLSDSLLKPEPDKEIL